MVAMTKEAQSYGRANAPADLGLRGAPLFILVGLLLAVQILDGVDMHALAFVGSQISKDLDLSRSALGASIGIAFAGMALGSIVFGWLADRFGRKLMLVIVVCLFGAGALATTTVSDSAVLFVLRFLTGIALGGAFPIGAAILIESVPRNVQTTAVSVMSIGPALGAAICGIVASVLVPEYGWQAMFFVGGLLPLALLPMIFLIVPSRRTVGRPADGTGITEPMATDTNGQSSLFRHGCWRTTLPLWIAIFVSAIPVFFVIGWLPTIAQDFGAKPATAALGASLFAMVGAAGGIIAGKLVDRHGLGITLGFAVLAGIGSCGLGLSLGTDGFVITCAAAGTFMVGLLTLLGAIAGQFYTTSVRAFSVGCSLAVLRVAASVSPWLTGILLDSGASAITLFFVGGALLLVGASMLAVLRRVGMGRHAH